MKRTFLILAGLLAATPAAGDTFKASARGVHHCAGVLGDLLGRRFESPLVIDMPASDSGSDGTIQLGDVEVEGATYTRSGLHFAIAGWTRLGRSWHLVSVQGKARGERVRGTFHYLPSGSTCFASGRVGKRAR